MKLFFSFFIFLIGINSCPAQQVRDSFPPRKDTSVKRPVIKKAAPANPVTAVAPGPDSFIKRSADTIKSGVTVRAEPGVPVVSKPDSLVRKDTIKPITGVTGSKGPDMYQLVLRQHPYFKFFARPRYEMTIKRQETSKDGLFYLLTGLVLYFALVRLLFSKYLSNLFAVFFRVSLKQKQIREQLLQSPLPSLLLNMFFIIAGGIYISFLLRHYDFVMSTNFWLLITYSIVALAGIYLVKFLILKVLGWVFGIAEATDTYIFVIFLVNKLLGILLVPFLILLAFSSIQLTTILVTLSFTMVTILFAYRYIISYAPVRKEIKVSQFHFFLYLCAFEIIPLLLIYKVLLTFLERSS